MGTSNFAYMLVLMLQVTELLNLISHFKFIANALDVNYGSQSAKKSL